MLVILEGKIFSLRSTLYTEKLSAGWLLKRQRSLWLLIPRPKAIRLLFLTEEYRRLYPAQHLNSLRLVRYMLTRAVISHSQLANVFLHLQQTTFSSPGSYSFFAYDELGGHSVYSYRFFLDSSLLISRFSVCPRLLSVTCALSQFSQSPTYSLCALPSRPLDFTSSPCFGFVNNTVIGLITSLDISASQIAFPLVRVRHQTSNHLAQLSPDSMCHLDSPLYMIDVAHQLTSSVCCSIGCC